MPIKGLTDSRRMTRLGKIRLGIKVQGERSTYPSPTDYFVCPPEVQAVFGEKPTVLRIMFPTEDPEQIASQYYRNYSRTQGLRCKGDGETALALVDVETGDLANRDTAKAELQEWRCPGRECRYYQGKQCREVMNLQFLLPEVPGIGVWQIDTSSIFGILNVNSAIELIKGVCGRISMLPLELHLVQQEVAPEGKKKVVRVLDLRAPYMLKDLLQLAQGPPGMALLPAPDTEVPDDLFPSEVADEGEVDGSSSLPSEPVGDDEELRDDYMEDEAQESQDGNGAPVTKAQVRDLMNILGVGTAEEVMLVIGRHGELIRNLTKDEADQIIASVQPPEDSQ